MFKEYLVIFLKGMAMGIAEVIPGVSGGTIAFVTGIYERLLNAIKSFNLSLIQTFKESGIAGVWKAIDGNFVVALGGGMAVSILSFVNLITWLIANYQVLVWAFFFGLVAASAVYVAIQIKKWDAVAIVGMLLTTVVAYLITIISPANGNDALWFIFFSGAIAISAMLLPGISGSFVLLLMGMYHYVFGALKSLEFPIIITFALGCLTGAMTFSRVLSWMFKKFYNTTLAVLTGFMIGSLNKVYPWRNVLETRVNSHGETVPFLEESVLPAQYTGGEPYVVGAIALAILGFAVVFMLEKLSVKQTNTAA